MYSYHKTKPKKLKEIPETWHSLLSTHVLFYQKLKPLEQNRFQQQIKRFVEQVYIEAVGFELQELDVVLTAASAVIPVFYFHDFTYPNIKTVLIYPDHFNEDLNYKGEGRNIGGLVGTGRFENQMILSRKALLFGFRNKTDKGNTGIHEFVHLLDKLDGKVDGIPEQLLNKSYTLPWLELMHAKMEEINNDTSDIRNYGGTKQEEFFAVASEYFFERPDLLKRKHPDLYAMLKACFVKRSQE